MQAAESGPEAKPAGVETGARGWYTELKMIRSRRNRPKSAARAVDLEKETVKKLISEFKTFISRGSVIDLAVGAMIGAAFKSIVDSLVNDMISPLVGLPADTNFAELSWQIGGVSIGYGAFVSSVPAFFLMAVVLFLLARTINATRTVGDRLKRHGEPKAAAPAERVCLYCTAEVAE